MPFFSFKQLLLLASCPRCYGEHHAASFFFVSGEPVLVFLTHKKSSDDATDTPSGYLILSFNKIPIKWCINNKISTDNLPCSDSTHMPPGVTGTPLWSGSVKLSGLSARFGSGKSRNPQSVSRWALGLSDEFDKLLVLILAFSACPDLLSVMCVISGYIYLLWRGLECKDT